MKALSQGRKAIMTAFEASLAAATTHSEIPIEATNRRFKKPDSGPWARLTLVPGTRNSISIGKGSQNLNRTPFILDLQIFVPENDGSLVAYEIAEQVLGGLDNSVGRTVAEGVVINHLFETVSIRPIGKTDGVEQFSASVAGHFDDQLDV